ncbi:MAG: class I SAM-dependent methyltransferase family protein [Desulfurococcaceae archaeon TW002]
MWLRCVKVLTKDVEKVLKLLKSRDAYVRNCKVKKLSDGTVAIPIKEDINLSIIEELLKNLVSESCYEDFYCGIIGLSFKNLLEGLVPEGVLQRIPSAYDMIGDIAIINIPEDLLEYGRLIGEAISKVSRNVKAVYAGGYVVGGYRVRKLRHIYGDLVSKTVHKEYGLRIAVDVLRTYYNPSLAEEHRRIAELVSDGELIGDLFCGVGSFSLHIASLRNATSYAVDFNPDAVKCLIESIEMNKKRLKGKIVPVLSDVKDFLSVVSEGVFDRIIMNLPLEALEYVPLVSSKLRVGGTLHVYLVSYSVEEAKHMVNEVVDPSIFSLANIRKVLDYAPRKYVFRTDLKKIA